MSNPTLNLSRIIDVTDVPQTFDFTDVGRNAIRGTFINDESGNATVYLDYTGSGTVETNTNAGADKDYIKNPGAQRVPKECKSISIACAAGLTAKIKYLGD